MKPTSDAERGESMLEALVGIALLCVLLALAASGTSVVAATARRTMNEASFTAQLAVLDAILARASDGRLSAFSIAQERALLVVQTDDGVFRFDALELISVSASDEPPRFAVEVRDGSGRRITLIHARTAGSRRLRPE